MLYRIHLSYRRCFDLLNKEKNKAIALILALLLCLSALGLAFVDNIKTMLVDEAKSNLDKITHNLAENLSLSLYTRFDILNALAYIPTIITAGTLESKIELIRHESNLKSFAYVGIADTSGRALLNDGSYVFIGDRNYYQIAMAGKPAMSSLITSRLRVDTKIITQAVPVFNAQGQVINVIFGSDDASNMTELITNIHYAAEAHVTFTEEDGAIIAQSKQGDTISASNLFSFLTEQDQNSSSKVLQALMQNQSDTKQFTIFNKEYYLAYTPMRIQNITWFIFVGVPADIVLAPAQKILLYTIVLVLSIILTITVGFAYIYNLRRKYIAELKVSEYRYKIITEQTDNIVLDWDICLNTIYFSKSWSDKFSHLPPADLANYQFPNVHTEDVNLMKSAIYQLTQGIQPDEFDIRVFNKFKKIIWFNIHLTLIKNENDEPCRVIGVLVDITDKKLKELQIKAKAEHDSLSKLYNKHTFEEKSLNEFAKSKDNGTPLAFLFIDIDDFRLFNNNFGHAFGDRVISFIGLNLLKFADEIGFAGRIGGDEFMVCITDAASISTIDEKVAQLQSILKSGLHARESDPKIEVGSSIGIVTMPYEADSYHDLVKKTDEAMYQVKASGKGHYMRIK